MSDAIRGEQEMLAQSLGEYGAGGSIASNLQSMIDSARAWLGDVSPVTWVLVAIVLLGLFVWGRR
jgi:hypothetical protein